MTASFFISRLLQTVSGNRMHGFHRMVAGTAITNGLILLCSMAVSVMLTRTLGVEGRGAVSWLFNYSAIGAVMTGLGMGMASKKYIAKTPQQAHVFLALDGLLLMASAMLFMPIL